MHFTLSQSAQGQNREQIWLAVWHPLTNADRQQKQDNISTERKGLFLSAAVQLHLSELTTKLHVNSQVRQTQETLILVSKTQLFDIQSI